MKLKGGQFHLRDKSTNSRKPNMEKDKYIKKKEVPLKTRLGDEQSENR